MAILKQVCFISLVYTIMLDAVYGTTIQNITTISVETDMTGHPIKAYSGAETEQERVLSYQVAIRLGDEHVCGGSILSDRVIITGAYCMNNLFCNKIVKHPKNIFAVPRNSHEIQVAVKNIVIHPNEDLALLYLDQSLSLNDFVKQISLPSLHEVITQATLTDWIVYMEDGQRIGDTVAIDVSVTDCSCDNLEISESNALYCTEDLKLYGRQRCSARSGSPLIMNETLIGIAAAGISCNESCNLAIFTNVFLHKYWILSTIAKWEPSMFEKILKNFRWLGRPLYVVCIIIGVVILIIIGSVIAHLVLRKRKLTSYSLRTSQRRNFEIVTDPIELVMDTRV